MGNDDFIVKARAMSRLEEVVGIYEETDKMTEEILKNNVNNLEMGKVVALTNISQSLKNIDISLAIITDKLGCDGVNLD